MLSLSSLISKQKNVSRLLTEYSKRRSQLLAEKILKSISSAVYLSQHLLFSELTQPIKRTQKVNKDLTPSDFIVSETTFLYFEVSFFF